MHLMVADIVWPALLLVGRTLTWWSILVGLVVEYSFVRSITNLSYRRAALANAAMNTVSALLGLFLIPLAGCIWDLVPGQAIQYLFHTGVFSPVAWIATFLVAAAVNTYIERGVLRSFFRQPVEGQRAYWLLFTGNAISIAIACGSIISGLRTALQKHMKIFRRNERSHEQTAATKN